ncbi:MAG TPA: aspartate 1-decarboxylase [Ignavibacteria bacterium]|nr:aspartate 1-decarboxylase [Ignavibacteria bacterium]
MQRIMCKSKIHRAHITQAELYYEGSLTLDTALMDAAGMLPYERVQIVNVNNGERFETYLIPGKRNSGVVCLNGAAARLGAVGDQVIIISYAVYDENELKKFKPVKVFVDKKNKIKK